MKRSCRGLPVLVLLLWVAQPLWADSPAATACAADPRLPSYPTIEPNVEFWKRVFGEWSQGQVVVHDLDYPAIVYDVVDLPEPIEERYTEEQKDFIEDVNERWQARLEQLAAKVAARDPLGDDEKRLALTITTEAGSQAIEDASERVRTQRGLRERFGRGLEISHSYEPLIREMLRDAGLPEDLAYLPHVESSYQASARSSAGAVGVWQFTRGTGRRFLTITSVVDERLDPILAARGAVAYLDEAYRALGDWALALTSYNHGLNGMIKASGKLGADYERVFREYDGRLFGFASRNFYSEFLAAREVACHVDLYFPEGLSPEPLHDLDSVVLESRTTASAIATAYVVPQDTLAALNPSWTPRAVRERLPLPRESWVWLPAGALARLRRDGIPLDRAWANSLDDDGTYVVRSGDTLSTVAASHGLSLSELRILNELAPREELILVGQRLRVGATPADSVHLVRRGDTLSGIAGRYGISVQKLRVLNGFAPSASLIRSGQRLRVDGKSAADVAAAATHVVRRGDTLIRIAIRYGVTLTELLLHNGLSERSVIYPGQLIRIP